MAEQVESRAYSIITIKSADDERRIITGIATTPEPDDVGDVCEPLGVEFENPLPLLLHHDRERPVGTAWFDPPTKDGIGFCAELPTVAEPGAVKDRVDEAYHSLKYGLIRGVSVKIQALREHVERRKGGGLRFLKSRIPELSLVTMPANRGARILTVKEMREFLSAAPGPTSITAPGASGISDARPRARGSMKTISDRITAFKAEKLAKVTRLNELVAKDEGGDVTLDGPDADEFTTLQTTIKSLDDQIGRLEYVESTNKAMATVVSGTTPALASAARGGAAPVITVKQNLEPGIEFARMVLCKAASFVEMQKGNFVSPLEIAKQRYPDNYRIHEVLKAAVPAATTSDSVYVGPLIDPTNLASEFIEYLRPQTIVGKFGRNGIPSLRRVPFNVRVIGQTSDAEAYWVGQGKPKPLTRFALEATTLTWAKIATIAVLTEESVRYSSPSAEALARDAISNAVIKRMDIDFVDPDKAASAGVSPASITNGITPLTSAGTSADNLRTDLMNLLATFVESNNPVENIVLIMSSSIALAISLMVNSLGQDEFPNMSATGGRLRGLPVITSQYLSLFTGRGNMVIAVNPSEIFLSDDGQVSVDVSREASLEMSDAPTQNGAVGTGASLVSMWQNNLVALRAERFVNWARRRTEAVAFIDDVNWGAIGSPAL